MILCVHPRVAPSDSEWQNCFELAPEDSIEFSKDGFGEVLKKIVTKPFAFYFSATGYHWLMMEYVFVRYLVPQKIQSLFWYYFRVAISSDAMFFTGYFSCDIVFCGRLLMGIPS